MFLVPNKQHIIKNEKHWLTNRQFYPQLLLILIFINEYQQRFFSQLTKEAIVEILILFYIEETIFYE